MSVETADETQDPPLPPVPPGPVNAIA